VVYVEKVIDLGYENIDQAINILASWLGKPTAVNSGREIGAGAKTKARWTGPGWIVWTDHYRTANHGIDVKAFLSFENAHNETIFRLKHPDLCS
jgi:hypothetical protein